MPDPTVFGNAIVFLDRIGIYDVVLPFILVFTIVFAILEKSRVFGTETVKGVSYTKKNVNALVSFSIAFFVVASSQLVQIITKVSSRVVILLLTSVFFLILIGSFSKEGPISLEGEKYYRGLFMAIMFVGIVIIFLSSINTAQGYTWLEFSLLWLQANISSGAVASIVILVGMVFFIYFITQAPQAAGGEEKKK